MLHLRQRIAAVAPTDVTLLICGETGSGKELVARAVHQQSARAGGPLVAVNCAAIPETLQDSELFGHERGAFTGALSRRIGRFEQANGGTFLLDEVGELSPTLQAKLLRVLQERTFHRVGGSKEVSTDIRVVTATHRDLRKDVQSGRFRSDLFFRLSVFELRVPPLRERRSDVLELAEHFLHAFALHHRRPVLVLGESARQALLAYDWPGNVRELQSAVEHAAILAKNGRIELKDLPKVAMYPVSDSTSARQAVTRVERDLVAQALAESGGNATTAMRRLGMPRSTFYRRLRQYGLLPVND
jgi:DNA-binding NtrC family response regulator